MPLRPDPAQRHEQVARLRWPARVARPLAPLIALLVWALLHRAADELSGAGAATAAVGVLMALWWMTEALPLPVTALLPLVLFPVTGVLPIGEASAPYASKYIFLFMGGFMIALAIERWNLHRRIALRTVLLVGTRPARLVGGFMAATAFLSLWISNTATTLMMLPIGVSVILLLEEGDGGGSRPASARARTGASDPTRFGTCLMLGIAYAASIGGVGTLVGTPPNVFLAGFLHERGIDVDFAQWMLLGIPFAGVFLVAAWLLLTRAVFRVDRGEIPGARRLIRQQLREQGPMSRGEWLVLAVFLLTAGAWVSRGFLQRWPWLVERAPLVARVDDTTIALAGAILLFLLPVSPRRGIHALDWPTARRLPWGVLLLFGGGLSLAAAVSASGLDVWIGSLLAGWGHLPTVALVSIVTLVVIFLTELTSNIATASAFLPVLGGVALGLDSDPMLLFVPAALAASCAFMLPVATPPNAIVFASRRVDIGHMVRAGLWLNVVAALLIPLAMYVLGIRVLGASP